MRYVRAIEAQDWQQMAALLHDDARYHDPTMSHFDIPAVDLSGVSPIVNFWRQSAKDSGTREIRYTVTECFNTAAVVVINLDIAVEVAGRTWNINRDSVTMKGPLVMVLSLDAETGKIREHTDYVHYASITQSMRELQGKYGKLKD